MDARDEGFVDVAGTVGCKLLLWLERFPGWLRERREGTDEEDAIEVFEFTKKDGDESVTLYVVDLTISESVFLFQGR